MNVIRPTFQLLNDIFWTLEDFVEVVITFLFSVNLFVDDDDENFNKWHRGDWTWKDYVEWWYNHFCAVGNARIGPIVGDRRFKQLSSLLTWRGTSYLFIFGVLLHLACGGLFLYSASNQFLSLYKKNKFLSLNPESGTCHAVPRPWTVNSLLADANGNWEGSARYNPSLAIYGFDLHNAQFTNFVYSEWMSNISQVLEVVGNVTAEYDLGVSLLYWSSWYFELYIPPIGGFRKKYAQDQKQYFYLMGDSAAIIRKEFQTGTIANVFSDCHIRSSKVHYDRSVGILNLDFDIPNLTRNFPLCYEMLNLDALGYRASDNGDTLQLPTDVNSMFAAMAVNMRVNGEDSVIKFTKINTVGTVKFLGQRYYISRFVDQNYPTMLPIFCVGPHQEQYYSWYCFVQFGNSFAVPFLNHNGYDAQNPSRCNCSEATGRSTNCDKINLLTGVLFYDHTNNLTSLPSGVDPALIPFLPMIEFFFAEPVMTGQDVYIKSYELAWAAIHGQNDPRYNCTLAASISAVDYTACLNKRASMYNWTRLPTFGLATVKVHQSFSRYDNSVTQLDHELLNGACSNSMWFPTMELLAQTPFGILQEDYVECTAHLEDAIFSSIGVSAGLVVTLVPLGVILSMYVVLLPLFFMERRNPRKNKLVPYKVSGRNQDDNQSVETRLSKLNEQHYILVEKLNSYVSLWGFTELISITENDQRLDNQPAQLVDSVEPDEAVRVEAGSG